MKRHLPLVALAAWAAVIFAVSSIPNPPDAGGGDWRYNVAHVLEYTILGALALGALRSYFPDTALTVLVATAWAFGTLYGMSDEFHQSFVPNRHASWLDVGLDSLGSLAGAVIVLVLSRPPRHSVGQLLE